jgi:hypothetical protein
MLFPLVSLNPDVTKRVSLWDRELVTATETVGWLLDRFAFSVRDFPNARPAVAEALDAVPAPLLAKMAARLAGCQVVGGGWRWPPGGPGLPTPGPGQWGVAGPAEEEALGVLAGWLQDRTVSR